MPLKERLALHSEILEVRGTNEAFEKLSKMVRRNQLRGSAEGIDYILSDKERDNLLF
jgi:hypothetical protein